MMPTVTSSIIHDNLKRGFHPSKMQLFDNIHTGMQTLYQSCIRPTIRWLSEYINILYYTNQLVAYVLAIIALFSNTQITPLAFLITVPSLSILLMCFIIIMKRVTPSENNWLYTFSIGVRNILFAAYTSWPIIVVISILSSICLVISADILMSFYAGLQGMRLAISHQALLIIIIVCGLLKFAELAATVPLIRFLKRQSQLREDFTEKPSAEMEEAIIKPLDTNQEYTRIYLHCFNYFVGFSVNSLTVIIALLAASGTTLTFISAWSLLASLGTLSLLSCLLIFTKQQQISKETIENYDVNNTHQPTPAPMSLPDNNFADRVGTTLGGENRTGADSFATVAQLMFGSLGNVF
jgi:hypothetical protein